MKFDDVDPRVVRMVLSRLPKNITTLDVSQHPQIKECHPGLAARRGWNALIGMYLSSRCPGTERLSRPGQTPATWRNLLAEDAAPAVSPGPQYAGDNAFKARMRLHQSWYRAEVLKVPHGRGPRRRSTRELGNMLRPEDAAAGRNFINPQIFETVKRRLAQGPGVEEYRVLHDMLSSQPMCFNLFAPLSGDPELATKAVRSLWTPRASRVLRIEIEWAPQPASEYLADSTSFDAFIEFELDTGDRGFLGIETKLTEPFSQRHYDKPTYRRWMTTGSPWRGDAHREVDKLRWNQLWRNHLLVWSMLRHRHSRYTEGRCVVVRHPEDVQCAEAIAGYQDLLDDAQTFEDCPLDQLIAAWRDELGQDPWLNALEVRYLALHRSQHLVDDRPALISCIDDDGPIRSGHTRQVVLVEDTEAYRLTRELYRKVVGRHAIYLRPTELGLIAVCLDHENAPSMIGVGRDASQWCLKRLPPTEREVRAACAGYLEKLVGAPQKPEERFVLRLLANALNGDLSLPIEGVYFVHQEWRFGDGQRLDILGADPVQGRLVVIELKASEQNARKWDARKEGDAWAQARRYAERLFDFRKDYYPFFQRLARALARAHGAPRALASLTLHSDLRPRAEVLWPDGRG